MQDKPDAAGAEVLSIAGNRRVGLGADVREQPCQQSTMNRGVSRVIDRGRQRLVTLLFRHLPAELGNLLAELPVQVAPFAQPQVGHEMRATVLDQTSMRHPGGKSVGEELPQRHQTQKIRALIAEAQVRLIRRLALVHGPVARIGHCQRARDDQRFGETAACFARQA